MRNTNTGVLSVELQSQFFPNFSVQRTHGTLQQNDDTDRR